jgi:hypothetical protein
MQEASHHQGCKHIPFLTASCCDPRLTTFLSIIDHGQFHRDRRFGGGLNFCINIGELLMLSHVANSFVDTRFDHRLVFFHTDCAALRGNTVFSMLNRKRVSFTPDTTGDLAFNRRMAANLMEQIRNIPTNAKVAWHIGIIDTDCAAQLSGDESPEQVAMDVVDWPLNPPPLEIFRQTIHREPVFRIA